MLFMVIEQFKSRSARQVYHRARQMGRMLPEGLHYIDSWVATDFNRCFQLIPFYSFSGYLVKHNQLIHHKVCWCASSIESDKFRNYSR